MNAEVQNVTVVVDDDADADARDLVILSVPGVAEEAKRYEPVVRKLSNISLLAIVVVAERETRRRAKKVKP